MISYMVSATNAKRERGVGESPFIKSCFKQINYVRGVDGLRGVKEAIMLQLTSRKRALHPRKFINLGQAQRKTVA